MLFPFVCLHLFFKKRDRSTKLFQSGVRNQALAMRVAKRRRSSTLVLFFPHLGGPIPIPFCQWDFQGPPIMGPPYGKLPIL